MCYEGVNPQYLRGIGSYSACSLFGKNISFDIISIAKEGLPMATKKSPPKKKSPTKKKSPK